MPRETIAYFDADAKQTGQDTVEIPDSIAPVVDLLTLPAQAISLLSAVDDLTDQSLGGSSSTTGFSLSGSRDASPKRSSMQPWDAVGLLRLRSRRPSHDLRP